MDGATIRENIDVLGQFHTGGVPGRHKIDGTQETHYPALMEALVDLNYSVYIPHEFVPKAIL